ncbi:unnamed protein product [Prorocentrum cordatum]|uniref:Pentatricopeptide repeat-containing protein, chloroplastic n=1 Tax=Prorocentrum cordatum TaxID=2364126 RepID=A0ABN9X051_9DINO|nr:unnamed protein product [Polarella glacialis]
MIYAAGVSACGKGGRWQLALALISESREVELDPGVMGYTAGIGACEKSGQWQQALSLLGEMLGARLEADVWAEATTPRSAPARRAGSGSGRCRWWPSCRGMLGWSQTSVSFNAAISACEKCGQWQQALLLFVDLRLAKLTPDVITYSAGASACEKGGQWRRALSFLKESCEGQLEADVFLYSAGISACGKCGEWQRALALFNELLFIKLEPDANSYTAGISACEDGYS